MSECIVGLVRQRQEPLRKRYYDAPEDARIMDHAETAGEGFDPFHGSVVAGSGRTALQFGIHRAVGGDHDRPNPGDLLCAALAACLDSTLRMIADRMDVTLETLEVHVSAFVDVRGCLMVDRNVPVGFQRMEVDVRIRAGHGTSPEQNNMLRTSAEQCCVVLQTLRSGVPVRTEFSEPVANPVVE